jgi:transposase
MTRDNQRVGFAPLRPYGLGIDCHSRFCVGILNIPMSATGEMLVFEHAFPANIPGITGAKAWFQMQLRGKGVLADPLSYVLESTATYHLPVVRIWGGIPHVINPALAAEFKARKTDKWDASKMALQHLQGLWEPSYLPGEEQEVLRCLLRHRRKSATHATRCYSQISLRLSQWYNPLCGRSSRDKALRAAVEDISVGRTVDTTGVPELANAHLVPRRVWVLLEGLYREASAAELQRDTYEKQGMEVCRDNPKFKLLQTIPGVGPICAAMWIAEVEPTTRFSTAKKVVAYTGFDPTLRISAGKVVGDRCRKGNKYVHSTVVQAAHTVLRLPHEPLAQWALSKKGKRHKNIIVHMLGRKLVETMYKVSLRDQPYDQQRVSNGQEVQ